jgi:voltage-dependent potassium channel beta subunit
MLYRRLGRSGLKISALSLGSWQTFGLAIDDSATSAIMQAGYEAGINFFDGAENYGPYLAEEAMGRIFKKFGWRRDTLIISSKVSCNPELGLLRHGLSRKHLVEACDQALKRMGLDYVDLFFCHRPDPDTPLEETVRTMNELIQRGKILYWGTSEFSAADLLEMHAIADRLGLVGPLMEQSRYSLLQRGRLERELLPLFDRRGMGTTIWSPLEFGLLTGKYNDGIPPVSRGARDPKWMERIQTNGDLAKARALGALARELGVAQGPLSLAWTLKNPNVSTAILGASTPEQLQENLTALDVLPALTPEVMTRIDAIVGTP